MAERPEDLNLPNAVVTRIIKEAIPEGVAVSKEARLAISKAASVFVLYATSCSNNFALRNKRKTINAQDVLAAMEDMEFEQFIEPLQQCQEAFRQEKNEKKKERLIKIVEPVITEEDDAPKKRPATKEGADDDNDDDDDDDDDEDQEKNSGNKEDGEDFEITEVNKENGGSSDSEPEVIEGDD